jgi:hypothetical protein
MMNAPLNPVINETQRYAKCIAASKRVNWDIDADIIRNRQFDMDKKFLPDGLSKINDLPFLTEDEKIFFSQVQGRTYANVFGLVERFICAKVIDISNDYVLGDQVALEALVRFSDEELKHQELFRRLDHMAAAQMPAGYSFAPDSNEVARVVLGKSDWAVLALTLHIELFTQSHYRQSIDPDTRLSALWKDVFLYHWKEESQHAILDELEWIREDEKLSVSERDRAVNDFIELVVAVDNILKAQSLHDASYFVSNCNRAFTSDELRSIEAVFLSAYRWQYIISGVQNTRFSEVLGKMINDEQSAKVMAALSTIM